MARPRQPDAVRRILDAAEGVLIRDGLKGAQMSSIAADAGLGLGTIYSYFRNREDLFAWVVIRVLDPAVNIRSEVPLGPPPVSVEEAIEPMVRVERFLPRVHDAIRSDELQPIKQELTEVVDEFCGVVERHDRIQTIVEVCARDDLEVRRLWYLDYRRALVRAYAEYFRCRTETGRLQVDDPEFAARWLTDTAILFLRLRRLDYFPDELPDDRLREKIVKMTVDSLLGGSG